MPTKYWEPILGKWLISEPNPYALSLTSEQWHRIRDRLRLRTHPPVDVTDYELDEFLKLACYPPPESCHP